MTQMTTRLALLTLVASGCATTPIAFSVSTNAGLNTVPADPEVWSRGSALQLNYELTNTTTQKMSVCLCAAAVHVESITRDGQHVEPVLLDVNLVEDPRAFFKQQIRDSTASRSWRCRPTASARGASITISGSCSATS